MLTNLLGIFAALFLGVAAYFGWENMEQYKTQIAERQTEERLLKQEQDKLEKTQGEVKVADEDLTEKKANLAKLEEDLDAQNNVVADLEGQIEDQKLSIADRKQELAEAEKATSGAGDPEELLADVKKYKVEIAELEIQLTEAESDRVNLEGTSVSLNNHIEKTRENISLYTKQQSNPNLSTSVADVYGGFGFVTINGGDQVGIVKGSTLNVVRGSDTIAKLLVTAVETNRAAANIVPDSLAPDTSVYPGDKVIAATN